MKKSLSLLLAIALVFSLFANAALAAEQPSLNDKYQALVDEGVFTPYPDGDPRFDEQTTRGQFAKIVTLVAGLEEIEGTYSFNDNNYTKHWARPYVEAVYAAGIMQGKDLNKMIFGVNDNITIEEMAKVLATILGLEEVENAPAKAGVSKWAYGWVKAIEDAGFVLSTGAYNVPAKRSLLVEAAYQAHAALSVQVESVKIVDSKNIEVTFTDGEVVKVELDKALEPNKENVVKVNHNGKIYNVTVKLDKVLVDKVAQSGAKKIKVTFNRGLNADEKAALSYELKYNTINYSVTAKYAEDNASVELEANYLPAGDFTLTVKGFDPFTVKVEEAKATKIEIGAEVLQKAANQDLKVSVQNQFGEAMQNVAPTISAYGPKGAITVTGGKIDLSSNDYKVDDTVVVSTFYQALAISKTYKIVDPSAATTVTLGQVVPKKDKTRISVDDTDLVLPYTFTDQYGQKVLLTGAAVVVDSTIKFGDIQFSVTNPNVINPNSFKLDADGVLTFNTGNTAGTATILVLNLKTGANASTTVTVQEADGKVAKFELVNPGVQIVSGEEVTFPYNAVDNYGAPIAAAEFAKALTNGQVKITANGGATLAAGYPKWSAKGDLKLKFNGKGATFIFVQDQNGLLLSQLNVDVKEASKPDQIVGLKGLATVFAKDGQAAVNADSINIVDNYGRSVGSLPAGYSLKVETSDAGVVAVNGTTLTGGNKGNATITVTLQLNGQPVNQNGAKFTFTASTIENSDIATFAIKEIPTLYGYAANNSASGYAKTVEVVGKTASGQEVAIKQDNYVARVTSSDLNVVGVDSKKIFGKAKGSATVAVWDSKGNKLNEVTVNVSDVAPNVSSVKIEDGAADITITGAKQLNLAVTDQYGVAIAAQGFWTTSNDKVVTVDQNGNVGLGTDAANGSSATVTFVTNTGVSTSIVVFVEK